MVYFLQKVFEFIRVVIKDMIRSYEWDELFKTIEADHEEYVHIQTILFSSSTQFIPHKRLLRTNILHVYINCFFFFAMVLVVIKDDSDLFLYLSSNLPECKLQITICNDNQEYSLHSSDTVRNSHYLIAFIKNLKVRKR